MYPLTSPLPTYPEDPAALLRHDLRNRLSTIRSAATFLRKQAVRSGFDQTDPRIVAFLTLIETEVGACDQLLGKAGTPAPAPSPPAPDRSTEEIP